MGGRQSSSSDASESAGDVGPVAEWLERVYAHPDGPYDAGKLLDSAAEFDEVTRMHLNISLRYAGSWAVAVTNVRDDTERLLGGRSYEDAAVVLLTIVHTHDTDAATLVEDMRFMFDDDVAEKVQAWTESVCPLGTPLPWEMVREALIGNIKAGEFYNRRQVCKRTDKIVKHAVRVVF